MFLFFILNIVISSVLQFLNIENRLRAHTPEQHANTEVLPWIYSH